MEDNKRGKWIFYYSLVASRGHSNPFGPESLSVESLGWCRSIPLLNVCKTKKDDSASCPVGSIMLFGASANVKRFVVISAQTCPRLSRPEHGTILPTKCMLGHIYSGERCVLHCAPGFKPVAKRTAVCDHLQNWTPSTDLNCVPVETQQQQQKKQSVSGMRQNAVAALKPFIKCPQDAKVVLPKDQTSAVIRIEQPQTNVDWQR